MEQGNGVGAGQTGAVGGANPMGAEQVVAEQVTVAQVEPAAPAELVTPVEPVAPGSMVAEPKTSKKGHGMAIGLIFCLLLAAGGVGLGVWAWMDGNTQKDALNSQINTLKKQNSDLLSQISELNEKIAELENDDADEAVPENGNADSGESTSNNNTSVIRGEVVDGVFYVKDSSGNILAQSSKTDITEVVSCDSIENGSAMKCSVTASDGSGWFIYNVSEKTLTSSFDAN